LLAAAFDSTADSEIANSRPPAMDTLFERRAGDFDRGSRKMQCSAASVSRFHLSRVPARANPAHPV